MSKVGNGIKSLMMALFIDLHIYWSLAQKCGITQITIGEKHSETCLDCIECPLGMGSIPQCGSFVKRNITVMCQACVEGVSYSDTHDYTSCKSCRHCVENEEIIKNCTPTTDTECGKCKPGYYRSFMYSCEKCSRCCDDSSEHDLAPSCLDQGFPRERACQYTGRNCGEMKPTSFKRVVAPSLEQSTTRRPEEREKKSQCPRSATFIIVFLLVILLFSWTVIVLLCIRYQRESSTTSYPVRSLTNHIELGNNLLNDSEL